MLEIRPNCENCENCENCDCDLAHDSPEAMICTFECTFCRRCVDEVYGGVCPNCGGNFQPRLIRPKHLLEKYPPSVKRVTRS